ncbi:hypothetical protein [Pseudogemmobacter humi]|uniref:Uncharacterized protein n=1 Tax=Pseudogemmobacter humi TaxID=2483812 RepID=A0A3P5XB73_9RHOB|nr:hypothetical protein [Pseudogemmobacter humi]VDC31812.1 hypothetical protein XINFAN_03167 [Pseudogemmobacter humi]
MRKLAMLLAVLALPALAGEAWHGLSDEAIAPALAARSMAFPDGTTWGFFADGRVLEGGVWGRWQVGDETLCLIWPGAEARCYTLEASGIDLRFTPLKGGTALVARYSDL